MSHAGMAGEMDRARAFVYFSLLVYFGLRIRASTSKFYEGRLSTSSETRHAGYLRYPSFTVCPIMSSNWSGGAGGVLGGSANDVDYRVVHLLLWLGCVV